MMRLITKLGFVSLLLAFSVMLYSCVDEPTMTPITIPYTSLRVGNFSSNVDPMTIIIDGKKIGTFSANSISSRFDVTSGARNFLVIDVAGDTVYNKSVTADSFEEETMAFAGYYSDVDTLNSFGINPISEGKVYVGEFPPADSSWVTLINFVTDTPLVPAKKIDFFLESDPDTLITPADTVISNTDTLVTPADTLVSKDTLNGSFKFGVEERKGGSLKSRKYYYTFVDSNSMFTVNDSTQFLSGTRYFIFVNGTQSNFNVTIDKPLPLPIRSK